MSRFRKKASLMNIFSRADDDRCLLHGSSSRFDGSLQDVTGLSGKETGLEQSASDLPEEYSADLTGAAASTDRHSVSDACEPAGQSSQLQASETESSDRVDPEKPMSPRRRLRERLRSSTRLTTGENPISPRKGFSKKSFSERIMGAVKPSSPKGSKVNHIGEIKVNFGAVPEAPSSPSKPLEIKWEGESPTKSNKTMLKSMVKKSRKKKEQSKADLDTNNSLNTKITATVQTVHSSDLQHSFHQLNLGEVVPAVVCEAVKSKELVDDLKKQNKHPYMMTDSSSDGESTDSSESVDVSSNHTDEEWASATHDIPRSNSDESNNETFLAHAVANDVKQLVHSSEFSAAFVINNKGIESHEPSEKGTSPPIVYTAKTKKLNRTKEVDVGRKPRQSKNKQAEYEVRTWVRSQQKRNSIKGGKASRAVEVAFSPPSSPNTETCRRRCDTENDSPSNHENIKHRKSPQSNKISPRQRHSGDAEGNRKVNVNLQSFSMPEELGDPASDIRFAEMKAVLEDFNRMDISDVLKHPNEHLKDVELSMATIPFSSCYIDVKDRTEQDTDLSESTTIDSMPERSVVGGGHDFIEKPSSEEVYWRLHGELEQSKARLLLHSQEVSRVEKEIQQLKTRLDEIKRS